MFAGRPLSFPKGTIKTGVKAFSENSCYISSEPLDENIRWEMMAKEEYLAIDLGDIDCISGDSHGSPLGLP